MDILDQELFDEQVQQYFEASKGKRFTNYIVDYIVYIILTFIFWIFMTALLVVFGQDEIILHIEQGGSLPVTALEYILNALLMITYYTLAEFYTKGKTLGKLITNTRAVQRSGEQMTFEIALKRSACRVIPFEAFSFLGDVRNGWHDSISNTKVIDINLPIQYTKSVPRTTTSEKINVDDFRLK